MKKILSIIIVGVVLLSITGGTIFAQTGPPQTLKEYCELGSNVTIKSGKLNGAVTNGCVKVGTANASSDYVCSTVTGAGVAAPCVFQAVGTDLTACTVGKVGQDANIDSWGMVCLINTVNSVTNWLFYLLIIAVVLMGVIGGALYMTSAGDAEKAGKGKSIITYAIIGLVLALVARLVPSVVRMIVGM